MGQGKVVRISVYSYLEQRKIHFVEDHPYSSSAASAVPPSNIRGGTNKTGWEDVDTAHKAVG
jgi:hypothetical protein